MSELRTRRTDFNNNNNDSATAGLLLEAIRPNAIKASELDCASSRLLLVSGSAGITSAVVSSVDDIRKLRGAEKKLTAQLADALGKEKAAEIFLDSTKLQSEVNRREFQKVLNTPQLIRKHLFSRYDELQSISVESKFLRSTALRIDAMDKILAKPLLEQARLLENSIGTQSQVFDGTKLIKEKSAEASAIRTYKMRLEMSVDIHRDYSARSSALHVASGERLAIQRELAAVKQYSWPGAAKFRFGLGVSALMVTAGGLMGADVLARTAKGEGLSINTFETSPLAQPNAVDAIGIGLMVSLKNLPLRGRLIGYGATVAAGRAWNFLSQ